MRKGWLATAVVVLATVHMVHGEPFVVVEKGRATCAIVVDTRGSTLSQAGQELEGKLLGIGYHAYSLVNWGRFLAERIGDVSGTAPEIRLGLPAKDRAIVISLAENYPGVARSAGLDFDARKADPMKNYDAFCIASSADTLYILGHTELACRHGVATVLEHMGFRFYNPSPRWWIAPRTTDLAVDLVMTRAPTFFNVEFGTNAGHHMNHGNGTETYLWDIQEIWYAMNRTAGMRFNPGPRFSAGPFAFDFTRSVKDELEEHPECFALLPDGKRDIDKPLAARKICVSNRRMLDLIIRNRLALLESRRSNDRFYAMVSAEYYGGNFTGCHCPECLKLGDGIDRIFTLVNEIAKAVRDKYPDAYVAIRHPGMIVPSIDVEKNVCVSISQKNYAPEWAKKVGFVGIRHGIAGYLPGGAEDKPQQVSYYKELVRFCIDNNVKSLTAGLAPAWGGLQTPLLYVATRLFWDPDVDTDALFSEYFDLAFGKASGPMRAMWDKLHSRSYRDDDNVAAMLSDLAKAYEMEEREDVRKRIVDVMFYVHGLTLHREFELVRDREGRQRTDAYYDALLPLMKFTARNSYRSMMCPSVLAQRYCSKTVLDDNREDFYWYRYEKLKPALDPVWMDPEFPWRGRPVVVRRGDPRVEATLHDDEVLGLFHEDLKRFSVASHN